MVLTWKEDYIIVLNRDTLKKTATYDFPDGLREGWGVTAVEDDSTGEDYLLYMSDGTSKIYHVDGSSMETIRSVTVKDKNGNA